MGFNYHLGAAASAWLLAIMVIVAELFAPFKDMLKATFGHHWIGKAVLVTVAFVVAGFLLANKDSVGRYSHDQFSWYSTLGSLAVILLLYIVEFVT